MFVNFSAHELIIFTLIPVIFHKVYFGLMALYRTAKIISRTFWVKPQR